MEKKQITVKEFTKRTSTGRGDYAIVVDQDNTKFYDWFPNTFPLLQQGMTALVGWEAAGNYKNIKQILLPEPGTAATPPTPSPETLQAKSVPVNPKPNQSITPQNREASIEAQVAFKGLVELDAAGKLEPSMHILIVAWAMDKMGIVPVKK